MELLILAAVLLAILVLIPFGIPGGLWLIVACALGYSLLVPASIGWGTLAGVTIIAGVAEVLDVALTARYTKKYGGSSRGMWGGIVGGISGAIVGVPVPLIGSIIGAFAGTFAGALLAELTGGSSSAVASRAATGALVGSVVATGMELVCGGVMGAWVIWAAWI